MGIKYDPKNVSSKAWPEDEYHARLHNVTEGQSKTSGNDMETWFIEVFHPSGVTQNIKDYVTAASAFKIRQLAFALDKKAEFEAGTFHAEDHLGASFMVRLKIEEDPEYGDKNKIGAYRAKKAAGAAPRSETPITDKLRERAKQPVTSPLGEGDFKDEDIPF